MGQRKKTIEVSNQISKSNPSYSELQNVLVEVHEDTKVVLSEFLWIVSFV